MSEIVISVSAVDSANVFGITNAGRLAKFDFEANAWVFKGASSSIIDIYAANNSKKGEDKKENEVEKELDKLEEATSFAKPIKKVVKKKAKSSRGLA